MTNIPARDALATLRERVSGGWSDVMVSTNALKMLLAAAEQAATLRADIRQWAIYCFTKHGDDAVLYNGLAELAGMEPNGEAADHLAAPVGEQEKAMPLIEVGDWVLLAGVDEPIVRVAGTDFDAGDGEKMPFGGGSWFMPAAVIEIRKADGRVWRRNG